MNCFERACRRKYRYNSNKGNIATEDLYDLSLEELDVIARRLHKEIEEGEEVSFIETKKPTVAFLDLKGRFEVVKFIIDAKLADKEKAEKAAETKAKKQRIMAMLEEKQDEELKGKSAEELEALLAELN